MLSQNKSKAITRIFLFFFPLPLLSTLFCLDLIYQNQYFKRKKESISCNIAIFFGLLAYSEFASRHSNFNFGIPYDFFLDNPFLSVVLILSLVVAAKFRVKTLFKYLELFEKD